MINNKLVLIWVLLFLPLVTKAQLSFSDGTYNYTTFEEGVKLTGRTNSSLKDIVVPSEATYTTYDAAGNSTEKKYKVVAIGDRAFSGGDIDRYYSNVASVSFEAPSNVKTIGTSAFYGASFANNKTLTIPGSVQHIGEAAFQWTGLNTVILENGVKSIGKGAFYDTALNSITFPTNGSLKHIGEFAFMWSSPQNVVVPEGVEYIGSFAFAFSSNPSINLPSTLTYFGNSVFFYNPYLKDITVAADNNILTMGEDNEEGILFSKDKKRLIYFSALQDLSMRHYQYKVPAYVKEIGGGAFSGAGESMKSIVLPTDLELIDSFAFIMNPLPAITIPANTKMNIGSIPSDCKEIFMMGQQGTEAIKTALGTTILYVGGGVTSSGYGGSINTAVYVKESLINYYSGLEGIYINSYPCTSKVTSVSYEIPATTSKVLTTLCRDFDVDMTDATLSNGVEAYTASGYGSGTFTDINNEECQGAYMKMKPITYIPSRWGEDKHNYTGVVLKSEAGKSFKYKIGENDVYSAHQTLLTETNMLCGAPCYTRVEQTETEDGKEYDNYGLNNGKFKKYSQSGIISMNKAYLRIPVSNTAKSSVLGFFFEEQQTTGVDNATTTANKNDDHYYNMNGQQIKQPRNGIFIHNGKKIFINK